MCRGEERRAKRRDELGGFLLPNNRLGGLVRSVVLLEEGMDGSLLRMRKREVSGEDAEVYFRVDGV